MYHWYSTDMAATVIRSTAKVFRTGRSQALRLPKAFQFDVPEVFIRRDEVTGDVILSTKAPSPTWPEFFKALGDLSKEELDQFPERSVIATKKRNPLF